MAERGRGPYGLVPVGVLLTCLSVAHVRSAEFVRGEVNGDQDVNIADAVYILNDLFAEGDDIFCADAADANDDGRVNVADAVYILQHMFAGGPAIPAPYPACGADGTADRLDCARSTCVREGFFFCLDRSSSMTMPTESGQVKFTVLKREVIQAISSLSSSSSVSLAFYDGGEPLVFGDPPIVADEGGKATLIEKVISTTTTTGSCMCRGMTRVFEIAGQALLDYRTVILISDGLTSCPDEGDDPNSVFNCIMAQNTRRIPINAIYVGTLSSDDWTEGKPLLQQLARATNGKFKIAE